MSGGHFDYQQLTTAEHFSGVWEDEELNELFNDLFGSAWGSPSSEFGRTWAYDGFGNGLAETLDLWKSCDIGEDEYREQVGRFKRKWLRRSKMDAYEFYVERFESKAKEMTERFKREMDG
jgi:hypothetical protein